MTSVLSKSVLLSGVFLFFGSLSLCQIANAAEIAPGMELDTELRLQLADGNNTDLDTNGSKNGAVAATQAKFKFTDNFNENDLFYWEGRGVASVGQGGFQDESTGAISNGNNFLEWRQSYLQFGDIDGIVPLNVRAGRQMLTDTYGIWWNQDFDALKLAYDSTIFKGSLVAGQNLFTYGTSQEGHLQSNDKDVGRVMATGSWQYYYQHSFDARVMYQDDHRNLGIGDTVNAGNFDNATGRLWYGGLRASGKTAVIADADKLAYRVDLLGVTGHEDLGALAGSTITGFNGQNVSGWALDASTDIPLPHLPPVIHLGYAYGSGDSNPADGTDHSFRQDGLNGNFSHIGALSQNTDNYGTVLRPDLTNIHIISAGATMPVLNASDVGVLYRYYRLADASTSLVSSGVVNALDGTHKNLGQGVDFLFNMDIAKEYPQDWMKGKQVYLRSSLGFFRSGDAYGTAKDETATRGLVELGVGF